MKTIELLTDSAPVTLTVSAPEGVVIDTLTVRLGNGLRAEVRPERPAPWARMVPASKPMPAEVRYYMESFDEQDWQVKTPSAAHARAEQLAEDRDLSARASADPALASDLADQ